MAGYPADATPVANVKDAEAPAEQASAEDEAPAEPAEGTIAEEAPAASAAPAAPSRPISWAERAQRHAPAKATSPPQPAQPAVTRNLVDYLVLTAKSQAGEDVEIPSELKRFDEVLSSSVNNIARASYSRLGIRNDANNCYANVVLQSLLSSASLAWFLRQSSPLDSRRPFCNCLFKLFKEFHTAKPDASGSGCLNALAMPELRDVISRWQRLGAQQDAGEFLLYLLNGMHDECKWKVANSETPETQVAAEPDDSDWSHLVKYNCRRMESRSAGLQEDSPIARIFGGVVRSLVRTKGTKADSACVEPFNHLLLEISHPKVDSVWKAIACHCNAESVTMNEGDATRRLQFEVMPKVLVLCLKRFEYSLDKQGRGRATKVQKPIKFGEKLVPDRSWMAQGVQPPDYLITAVICHHGDAIHGGHYTAAVRYNSDWYMYDDTSVRKLDLREVGSLQSEVYLLVYQCQAQIDFRP
eukprot:TRINITY_DN62612_c0_g1_i1.p1 TRINITY_DN62612_c0_g1~~TRINITY_DN62612_c0_g1_i1.p1  ORF type:complete len:470 (-),score=98.94 TRINITY_DN62612_c0_g1_i1:108-1517(-)